MMSVKVNTQVLNTNDFHLYSNIKMTNYEDVEQVSSCLRLGIGSVGWKQVGISIKGLELGA